MARRQKAFVKSPQSTQQHAINSTIHGDIGDSLYSAHTIVIHQDDQKLTTDLIRNIDELRGQIEKHEQDIRSLQKANQKSAEASNRLKQKNQEIEAKNQELVLLRSDTVEALANLIDSKWKQKRWADVVVASSKLLKYLPKQPQYIGKEHALSLSWSRCQKPLRILIGL